MPRPQGNACSGEQNWAAGNHRQSTKPRKGVGTGLEGRAGSLSPGGLQPCMGRRGLGRPWRCPLGPVPSAGDAEQGFGADAQGHSEPVSPCHHKWAPEGRLGPPWVALTPDLRGSATGTVGLPGRGSPGRAGPEAGDPASIRAGVCLPPLIPAPSFLGSPRGQTAAQHNFSPVPGPQKAAWSQGPGLRTPAHPAAWWEGPPRSLQDAQARVTRGLPHCL